MLFFSNSKSRNKTTVDLFDTEPKEYPLPILERNTLEDAYDEMELLGFPIGNPFALIADPHRGDTRAADLGKKINQHVHIVGYCVTTKDTTTMKGESMHFGTFYDCKGDIFDTVHFPDIAGKYPFRGRGFYDIQGKVVEDFGVFMIEVSFMSKLSMLHKRPENAMLTLPV
jgi:DNA polymerase-3 subunit alpha